MEQSTTKRLWVPLPYYFFSKPGIRIILREKQGERLFLLYMQLYCASIRNEGKLIYSQACSAYTAYTLALSLDGNFTSQEIETLLPILKERALIDYPVPEDPKKFLLNISICDFDTDFPLIKDQELETEQATNQESSQVSAAAPTDSSKKKVGKSHHPFTDKLIESGYIDNRNNQLPEYDRFFDLMIQKYEKTIGYKNLEKALDELMARIDGGKDMKISSKIRFLQTSYKNIIAELRKKQLFDDENDDSDSEWEDIKSQFKQKSQEELDAEEYDWQELLKKMHD